MTKKCFLLEAVPFGNNGSYTRKACGENSSLKPRVSSRHGNGFYWDVDGVDMFNGSIIQSGNIRVVEHDFPTTYGSCEECKVVIEKYDCINNGCIKASEYDTPGFYESLEDCETICGEKGCSGQCIGNSEWAKIKDLAKQIRNKNCN